MSSGLTRRSVLRASAQVLPAAAARSTIITTSFQPMWDISNTTTWIRGNHTLNFGANFRKWSLQRDLANDFLGQFTYSGFFTGNGTRDNAVAGFSAG